MIFLAFAFKVTKVSPMPDRNTCKLPFCSNLKSTSTRCHYWGGSSAFGIYMCNRSSSETYMVQWYGRHLCLIDWGWGWGVQLPRVCENPRSYVKTYFIDNLFASHLQTTFKNKFITSSPVYLSKILETHSAANCLSDLNA